MVNASVWIDALQPMGCYFVTFVPQLVNTGARVGGLAFALKLLASGRAFRESRQNAHFLEAYTVVCGCWFDLVHC
jgi:hypothetical protein